MTRPSSYVIFGTGAILKLLAFALHVDKSVFGCLTHHQQIMNITKLLLVHVHSDL